MDINFGCRMGSCGCKNRAILPECFFDPPAINKVSNSHSNCCKTAVLRFQRIPGVLDFYESRLLE